MIWMAFLDGVNLKKKKKRSSLYLTPFPNFQTLNKAHGEENGNVKPRSAAYLGYFTFLSVTSLLFTGYSTN